MRHVVYLLSILLLLPAWASEPGVPQDCTDWVSVLPGLTCEEPAGLRNTNWAEGGPTSVFDNEGYLYRVRHVEGPTPCFDCLLNLQRVELVRIKDGFDEVVGYFENDCIGPPCSLDRVEINGGLNFDDKNGRMFLRLQNSDDFGQGDTWVAAISDFTTTFDVLQTFEPDATTIGFRVPYMPEGMNGVDWFDTYWGRLANPIDFSNAKPLQCAYPSSPPEIGDYLTITDTLPAPSPGRGYYYITAATFQGETRYGRKAEGGQLSGRDPAVLPGCIPQDSN